MTIYVVKRGDSFYSIAKANGISPESIFNANRLSDSTQLIVGQTLVLPTGKSKNYIIKSGDSLFSIAKANGVSVNAILSANPSIPPNGRIYQGQVIIIPGGGEEEKLGTIEVNGYAFPSTSDELMDDVLSSLTYLSIFSYKVKSDGSLNEIDDDRLIKKSRDNGVAPIMVIANIAESGGFNSQIAQSVLNDEKARTTLINNIVSIVQSKNYYGVNVDFEYILPADREAYNNFLRLITARMNEIGKIVLTAVAPKLNAEQKGLLYEAHDYPAHGQIVNRVILMTYEWGYLAGPPQAVAPLDQVRRVVEYAVSVIPSNKILMGIPNYGYDWTLPYKKDTLAQTFSNVEAVNRALRNNSDIKFDPTAKSPYFSYYDAKGKQHIVWFEDARSIRDKLLLVNELKLAGISYWTVGREFPQNYLVLNSMFNIKKVI